MDNGKGHVHSTGKTTYHMGSAGSEQESWDVRKVKQGKLRSIKETIAEAASALKGRK